MASGDPQFEEKAADIIGLCEIRHKTPLSSLRGFP
jgi:hypothetical protein